MKSKLGQRQLVWLVFLVFVAVALRVLPIWDGAFAYMYDHARDSLAIWEMWELKKPALIGAQTSIPGLYYGPAWYYLALPLNVLLGFHPVAGAVTVVLLVVLCLIFAARSFDKVTTLFFATSVGLVAAQQSGWSPYLTSISSLVVLVLAKQMERAVGRRHIWLTVGLFVTLSLSFHFQPAFAIVQLPMVLFALRQHLRTFSLSQLGLLAVAFLAPFLPQVLFELRHDFHQTTQLWHFITQYQDQAAQLGQNSGGLARVLEVGTYVISSATSAFPANIPFAGFALVGLATWQWWRQRRSQDLVFSLAWAMVVGSFFCYLWLPAKAYYFVGLTPYWVYLLSTAVRKLRLKQKQVLAAIIFAALVQLGQNLRSRDTFLLTRNTYAAKQAAVELIAELAQGEPFVAYQYVPELYDYTYQVLHYRTMQANTKYQPVEIAYEPGKVLYLDEYSVGQWSPIHSTLASRHTFLVVETDERTELFSAWWQRVVAGQKVAAIYTINPEVTVFEL